MNRRHVLAAALIGLIPRFAAATPVAPLARAEASVERVFAFNGMARREEFAHVFVRVQQFRTAADAAATFQALADAVGVPKIPEGEFGMLNLTVTTDLDDLDLPVQIQTWTVVAGAAAVATSYGTALFWRDRYLWNVSAMAGQGNERELAIGAMIADLIRPLAIREIASDEIRVDVDGVYSGCLWDLLLTTADFPNPIDVVSQGASPADLATPTAG